MFTPQPLRGALSYVQALPPEDPHLRIDYKRGYPSEGIGALHPKYTHALNTISPTRKTKRNPFEGVSKGYKRTPKRENCRRKGNTGNFGTITEPSANHTWKWKKNEKLWKGGKAQMENRATIRKFLLITLTHAERDRRKEITVDVIIQRITNIF